MALGLSNLLAVSLLEKDINNELMQAWSYPGIDANIEPLLLDRCTLLENQLVPSTFSKVGNTWLYIFSVEMPKRKRGAAEGGEEGEKKEEEEEEDQRPPVFKWVERFSIAVLAKEYHPELYLSLARVMAQAYALRGVPVVLLQMFLSVMTSSATRIPLSDPSDPEPRFLSFSADDFDIRNCFLSTSIKDLIQMFGLEIILVWTALMMKKRIAVFSDRVSVLLKVVRTLPLFVWHRRDWSLLRPIVTLRESVRSLEEDDLAKAGVYIAGFTDPIIKSKQNLYDVLVDVNERSISVAEHAKVDFRLGAFHKDLATFLVESSENPEEESLSIIQELSKKTREFLNKLLTLQVEDEAGNRSITLESLQQRNLPPNMDHFLFAVAAAEGLTKS